MASAPVRVFLDSNVILSGLISDLGAPRIILDILSLHLPNIVGLTGRYNVIEIERNIRKKAPTVLSVYHEYFPKLLLQIVALPSAAELSKYRGLIEDKDVPVLVSALKGRADFLVTGDKKHFDRPKAMKSLPCRIVSPSEFLDELASILSNTT